MNHFLAFATFATLIAAVIDWRTGRIPNWLTYGALCVGITGHVAHGWAGEGAAAGAIEGATAVGGAVLCGLVPAIMFFKGGMGGGDVKLFAALGALCLPLGGIEVETYAFVAAALIAPARLVYRGELMRVLGNSLSLLLNPFRPAAKRAVIPAEMMSWFRLGPSIFVGTSAALLTHWYAP